MDISCPSCGAQHKSEDYPGVFEINCVCGYSILVPDEAAFKKADETKYDIQVPTSMEEEDVQMAIKPESLDPSAEALATEGAEPVKTESTGSAKMTPPDELPAGMIYDSFELPAQEPQGEKSSESMAPASEVEAPVLKEPSVAQSIVNRSQMASMGQFLGGLYTVRCRNLEKEAISEIVNRCRVLLKSRPWLAAEIDKSNIDLETFVESSTIGPIPEILAVEIFLSCYDLGGTCEFDKIY